MQKSKSFTFKLNLRLKKDNHRVTLVTCLVAVARPLVNQMIREFSAGAVVLRHMRNQWWVAVIEPGREGEPEDRKHVAALPKGNIDAGEKAEQAAVREVYEE